MNFLNHKLRRDVLQNWTQFFSVFLMALLSVLVYVGLEGVWYGMQTSVDTFIEESQLADSWIYATGFTDEDIETIHYIDGVEEISVKTSLQVSATMSDIDTQLLLETPGTGNISTPFIVDGQNISSELIGIWINLEYAEAHDLLVGNIISIELYDTHAELEILGIIQSPTRMYFTGTPDFIGPNARLHGYGIISEQVLSEKLQFSGLPNLIEIRGIENHVRHVAPDLLRESYLSYFNQSTLFEVSNATSRAGMLRNISFLFSFIFILLSILAMYTTIKRLIEAQTGDIATLKALGYSNIAIGFHYTSYGLLIGGIGAIIGVLLSPLVSLFVLQSQQFMFSVPDWGIAYTWTSLVVMVFVVSICVLSAFWASRKSRTGLPALFLRGNTIKIGKSSFFEKIDLLWEKLSFGSKWTFRDGTSNPIRILMGIIGVSGSMMLLLAGFGMMDSMNALVENSFGIEYSYTYRARINRFNTIDENANLQQDLGGQWIQILQAQITSIDDEHRVLTIFDEGIYFDLGTTEGEPMEQDGVYISIGFANHAGLQVGDHLSMRVSLDVNEYEFEIVGIVAPSTPQGIFITVKTWENAGGNFQPSDLLIGGHVILSQLEDDMRIESITLMEDQRTNALELIDSFGGIIRLIVILGIMLVIVILYNLGALNFTERTRDYATLRVLGFHRREIRQLVMRENLITTVIGWLIGIPLGQWFLEQYTGALSLESHIIFFPYLTTTSLVIASIIAIGFSLTTTFLLGRRIKNIDMVEAIKGVE